MIDPYLDILEEKYSSNTIFKVLCIKDNDICVEKFKRYGINLVAFVNSGLDVNSKWLKEIAPLLLGLRLNDYHYTNLEGIKKFKNLQYFQLTGTVEHGIIPFSELSNLKEVELLYNKKYCEQLFELKNLEYLSLHRYKDKSGTGLISFNKLKELDLSETNLIELNALSGVTSLEKFSISYSPKLTNIDGLKSLKETIRSVGFQNCKEVKDWSVLSELKKLEWVYFENCGEIESLQFLSEFPNLKAITIIGSTKILDGKLKDIINMPSIEYANICIQKNYDITREDLQIFYFIPFKGID